MRLEDLQTGAALRGVLPDALVTVVSVQWFGSEAVELTDKTAAGAVANELCSATTRLGSRSSSAGARGASTATVRCFAVAMLSSA